MPLQETIIPEDFLKRFSLFVKSERLAHAYLLAGPSQVGKTKIALGIAKLVICEKPTPEGLFCDQCSTCVTIGKGNHPDIHVLSVEAGETIKIADIRSLLDQMSLMPFMAQKKIFIVRNVEQLTHEAANALLKTLEEPSLNSLLLLTSSALDKTLDTIKSRCQIMYMTAPSSENLKNVLVRQHNLDASSAHFLSHLAQGSIGKALRLKEEDLWQRKNALLDEFLLSREPDVFIKKNLSEENEVREFIDLLLSWIRDAILIKSQVEDKRIVHLDRLEDLRKFSKLYSFEDLNNIFKAVVNTNKMLAENFNVKIPLLIIKELLWGK
jgi:DNA polymerase-3 subunit delta'